MTQEKSDWDQLPFPLQQERRFEYIRYQIRGFKKQERNKTNIDYPHHLALFEYLNLYTNTLRALHELLRESDGMIKIRGILHQVFSKLNLCIFNSVDDELSKAIHKLLYVKNDISFLEKLHPYPKRFLVHFLSALEQLSLNPFFVKIKVQ